MPIWGHLEVHVVKDTDKRVWVVSTSARPHQHLVTIPWVDAYKNIKPAHAPDYCEAIATCQSHKNTRLTEEEEDSAIAELDAQASVTKKDPSPTKEPLPNNVVSLADARRRKGT